MLDKDRPYTVTGDIFDIGVGKERLEDPHIDFIPDKEILDSLVLSMGKDNFTIRGDRNIPALLTGLHLVLCGKIRVEEGDQSGCRPLLFFRPRQACDIHTGQV